MKILIAVGLLFSCSVVNATDYKAILTGKTLVMDGANCAGISLKKNSGLSGEIGNAQACSVDLPARLRWVDESTFMLVEKNRTNESNPPRVYLYKVKSLKGDKVVLNELWTGWNNLPDDETTYLIK